MKIRTKLLRPWLVLPAVAALGLPLILLAGNAASAATHDTQSTTLARDHGSKLPPIRHVWLIDLENEEATQSFGDPSVDPYLAVTLRDAGAYLSNYFGIGHDSADNYIAQISGQAPDTQTQNDCGVWNAFTPTNHVVRPFHQLKGNGCVYPASVQTLGNQLTRAHRSWKAYLQDMGNDPARDHTTQTAEGPACGHPAVGAQDLTEGAEVGDQYATRHEGFMYFESVTGNQAYCDAHILSFQPLSHDLKKASTTPNFSFIAPNLCNDGHDSPCVNGDPGGLTQVNTFLKGFVPQLLASPAYKAGGLILITFDEGSTDKACCGETAGVSASHPNVAEPGMGGPGGGDVGLVALSPFIKPGTVSKVDYNHYSLLRTIEDFFGLSHLGDAAMPQVKSFGADVFTKHVKHSRR
jgi:hypothetical protein